MNSSLVAENINFTCIYLLLVEVHLNWQNARNNQYLSTK